MVWLKGGQNGEHVLLVQLVLILKAHAQVLGAKGTLKFLKANWFLRRLKTCLHTEVVVLGNVKLEPSNLHHPGSSDEWVRPIPVPWRHEESEPSHGVVLLFEGPS